MSDCLWKLRHDRIRDWRGQGRLEGHEGVPRQMLQSPSWSQSYPADRKCWKVVCTHFGLQSDILHWQVVYLGNIIVFLTTKTETNISVSDKLACSPVKINV